MPSTSKKQHRFMAAIANNPKFAKKAGVSQSVGKDFIKADKGKQFKEGGMALFKGKETPAEERKEAKALKSGKISKAQYVAGEKKEGHGAGAAKKATALKSGKMSAEKYAKDTYASGGMTKAGKSMPDAKDMGGMGMKKGGSCAKYARGGGIELRGKTKGRII